MNIAVIGVGNIGSRVATRLSKAGLNVTVAATQLDKAQRLAQSLDGVQAAATEDAIKASDVVIGAVPFAALLELVKKDRDLLAGKVFVDPSNNIDFDENGNARDLNPEGVSAGAQISEALGDKVHYVKSFGTMAAPELERTEADNGGKTVMLYATDDDKAGQTLASIAEQGGWDPIKVGGVDQAGRIEVFGELHPFGGLEGKILNKDEYSALI